MWSIYVVFFVNKLGVTQIFGCVVFGAIKNLERLCYKQFQTGIDNPSGIFWQSICDIYDTPVNMH